MFTVKEAEQVDDPQVLVTLKVTVFVPPQALGPDVTPLLVTVPPVAVAVASHVVYAAST